MDGSSNSRLGWLSYRSLEYCPVDREHVTVWPLFIMQPDIMTGAIGFTKKKIKLQHSKVGNF